MKRFADWFKGQSKKKQALIVSPPLLLLLLWGVIDSWHTRDTSVLSKGTVLAEGRLGAFKATGKNEFASKPATQRFVIGKAEVFEPGMLSGFSPRLPYNRLGQRAPGLLVDAGQVADRRNLAAV